MRGFLEQDFNEWLNQFKPLENKNGGNIFWETYGNDYRLVLFMNSFFPEHVWSLMDSFDSDSDSLMIINGRVLTNRCAYLITENPQAPNTDYEIKY